MKQITSIFVCLFLSQTFLAQVSGNINYQTQIRFADNNINVTFPSDDDLFVSVKGMANVKADSYVAIFNVTQTGVTTEEVNSLINNRIDRAMEGIRKKPGVETYIDMLSFVPVYEYEVEKKIFSKKTYNEVPAGFELKKNIHIKYSDPNLLNDFISALSNEEIYDLIRVDYFSTTLETIKKELMNKSKTMLLEKLKIYQGILNVKMDSVEKQLVDGYKVMLPVENYKSYQAYNSSSLNLGKPATVNQNTKSTTLYYQPVNDKEFDFVINPIILEPVIQVMYEIKLEINNYKEIIKKEDKEYIMVTPNGEIKKLDI